MIDKKLTYKISVTLNDDLTKTEETSLKARLQRTSTYLSKRLFEPLTPKNPLTELERLITQKTPTKSRNSLSLPKTINPGDQIHDHFNDSFQSKIVNLPKLPYGKHTSYNEEKDFFKEHFVDDESKATQQQVEELKKISKKFKMKNLQKTKKKAWSNINSPQNSRSPQAKYEEIRIRDGMLFVEKNKDGHLNYAKEKFRYSVLSENSSPKSSRAARSSLPISEINFPSVFEGIDQSFMLTYLPKIPAKIGS